MHEKKKNRITFFYLRTDYIFDFEFCTCAFNYVYFAVSIVSMSDKERYMLTHVFALQIANSCAKLVLILQWTILNRKAPIYIIVQTFYASIVKLCTMLLVCICFGTMQTIYFGTANSFSHLYNDLRDEYVKQSCGYSLLSVTVTLYCLSQTR